MANRIKSLREAAGLKQIDLAKRINVSQGTLSNWERGVHDPDNDEVIALASIFECSVDYLLCRVDNKNLEFGDLPQEIKRFVDAYRTANQVDKQIVELTLSKYMADSDKAIVVDTDTPEENVSFIIPVADDDIIS